MKIRHLERRLHFRLRLLLAVFVATSPIGCGGDDDSKVDDKSVDASLDSGVDSAQRPIGNVIELGDENNFRFEGQLTIPSVATAPAEDVQICWDELIKDIQCHNLDPLNDIDTVSLVRFRNLSEHQIEESLSRGELPQSNVDGYLSFVTDNAATCVALTDFTLFGTEVNIAEEYLVSDERVYMLLFSTGTVPGVGARMMTFITPSEMSDNAMVSVSSGCEVLDFDADLTSLTKVPIRANGPYTIDWSGLTKNGQGGELQLGTIDRVLLGFYAEKTPASLEAEFLDLELIATSLWEIDYSGGSVVDLADATNDDGPFLGFAGEGTWLFALFNTKGQNPAPSFLTILEPYASQSGDSKDKSGPVETSEIRNRGSSLISNIQTAVSDVIATVVSVKWTTEIPTAGYVAFGSGAVLERQTPTENQAVIEHEALLLGLTADTEYNYRVVLSGENSGQESGIYSVTTGSLPVDLPVLTTEGDGHDLYTLVPVLGATTAVMIVNPQGDVVWYRVDNRELDIYRARLSVDGQNILYNAASVSGDPADDSEIVRVSLDGKHVSAIPVPLLAHDFVEHPDGTIGAIATEYRQFEGVDLRGDKIVEVTPDGSMTTIWTSWDCFDPEADVGDDMEHGWTFANALDFDPVNNAYYLGMRNFSSIAKIDRDSGACEWVLGSTAATISFAPGASPFLHQHQFQVIDDAIIVFDNDGSPGTESRVIEYRLNFDALEASEVFQYATTPSLFTFVLGEPTRLDDGDIFINWSVAGQMERITKDGEVTWRINSPLGYAFGYDELLVSLYRE